MIPGALLLRRLEPAVHAAGELPLRAPDAIETLDFATLVAQAQRGGLASGRSIDVSALGAPISSDETNDLSLALDALALRGSRRAVILFGSQALLVDVASRRFERDIAAQESQAGPVDVDAALRVPRRELARPDRVLAALKPASTPSITPTAKNKSPRPGAAARGSQPGSSDSGVRAPN
jgi:hypothetical protein